MSTDDKTVYERLSRRIVRLNQIRNEKFRVKIYLLLCTTETVYRNKGDHICHCLGVANIIVIFHYYLSLSVFIAAKYFSSVFVEKKNCVCFCCSLIPLKSKAFSRHSVYSFDISVRVYLCVNDLLCICVSFLTSTTAIRYLYYS